LAEVRLVQVKQVFPETPPFTALKSGSNAVRVSRERTSFLTGPFFFIDRLLLTKPWSSRGTDLLDPSCGY
jgi:hypothetical protein